MRRLNQRKRHPWGFTAALIGLSLFAGSCGDAGSGGPDTAESGSDAADSTQPTAEDDSLDEQAQQTESSDDEGTTAEPPGPQETGGDATPVTSYLLTTADLPGFEVVPNDEPSEDTICNADYQAPSSLDGEVAEITMSPTGEITFIFISSFAVRSGDAASSFDGLAAAALSCDSYEVTDDGTIQVIELSSEEIGVGDRGVLVRQEVDSLFGPVTAVSGLAQRGDVLVGVTTAAIGEAVSEEEVRELLAVMVSRVDDPPDPADIPAASVAPDGSELQPIEAAVVGNTDFSRWVGIYQNISERPIVDISVDLRAVDANDRVLETSFDSATAVGPGDLVALTGSFFDTAAPVETVEVVDLSFRFAEAGGIVIDNITVDNDDFSTIVRGDVSSVAGEFEFVEFLLIVRDQSGAVSALETGFVDTLFEDRLAVAEVSLFEGTQAGSSFELVAS